MRFRAADLHPTAGRRPRRSTSQTGAVARDTSRPRPADRHGDRPDPMTCPRLALSARTSSIGTGLHPQERGDLSSRIDDDGARWRLSGSWGRRPTNPKVAGSNPAGRTTEASVLTRAFAVLTGGSGQEPRPPVAIRQVPRRARGCPAVRVEVANEQRRAQKVYGLSGLPQGRLADAGPRASPQLRGRALRSVCRERLFCRARSALSRRAATYVHAARPRASPCPTPSACGTTSRSSSFGALPSARLSLASGNGDSRPMTNY